MSFSRDSFRERCRIYLVAAEASPLAIAGGIAGYIEGLFGALVRRGWDVRAVIPAYKFSLSSRSKPKRERLPVPMGFGHSVAGKIYSVSYPDKARSIGRCYLLDVHSHFSSALSIGDIYRWPDFTPWAYFSSGAVQLAVQELERERLKSSKKAGDIDNLRVIFHCNDAHAALVPLFLRLRLERGEWPVGRVPACLLTVHNLLEQGLSPREMLSLAGFPPEWFAVELFEYYGRANCLKAGLVSADRVNTVSPSYCEEISSSEKFGFGLEGVFRELRGRGKFSGILNGIDIDKWKLDFLKYDGSDLDLAALSEYRSSLRKKLFPRWGWEEGDSRPVFAFRGRWDLQKGIRYLVEILPELLSEVRFLFVSWGYPGVSEELRRLWGELSRLEREFPGSLAVNPKGLSSPEETAVHYGISDFLVMPSTYEPCGLVQMECQRFGCIPVVHATGGLADTVSEVERSEFPSPNGITFSPLTSENFAKAVFRARDIFFSESYRSFLANALRQDNSWERRAGDYEELYFSLFE